MEKWRLPPTLERLARTTAFFYLVILYGDLVVKICTLGGVTVRGALVTALFTVPWAFLFGLACGGVPRRAGRVLLPLMAALLSLWMGAQVVYYSLFRTYLSLFSVTKAGMVVGSFLNQALMGVMDNWFPILFLLVPVASAFDWRDRLLDAGAPATRLGRLGWLGGAGLGHCAALAVVLLSNAGAMSLSYLYQSAAAPELMVENFGMLTATRLNVRQTLLGAPEPEEVDGDDLDQLLEEESPEEPEIPPPPDQPEEPARGDNVLPIDFEALAASTEDETLQTMDAYFAAVTPTEKNDWTGYFQGKNLIWIVAESYSGEVAIHPELTPTLYRLSREGFQFENFYTPLWGVSTSDGEYVTTTGLLPKSGVWSYLRSAENAMPFGFGRLFSQRGYRALAFHDHTYTYYGRDQSHPNMGYEFYGVGNGLELEVTWPESDVEMMEKSVPMYIEEDHFMVYYLTVSGHMNYDFTGNYIAYKNQALVEDLPYSEEAKAYLATQIELDRAVESLIRQLEAAGKLEDTVIVLSGDHYPYGLSTEAYNELLGHEVDPVFEQYKSRLLLWSSAMEEPVRVEKFCSSLDIMPTLANLFALPYDSRLVMGRDILSDAPGRVIFADYSFLTDAGAYDASQDLYTAWDGQEADPEDVRAILDEIGEQFTYSALILDNDYYRHVLPDGVPAPPEEPGGTVE